MDTNKGVQLYIQWNSSTMYLGGNVSTESVLEWYWRHLCIFLQTCLLIAQNASPTFSRREEFSFQMSTFVCLFSLWSSLCLHSNVPRLPGVEPLIVHAGTSDSPHRTKSRKQTPGVGQPFRSATPETFAPPGLGPPLYLFCGESLTLAHICLQPRQQFLWWVSMRRSL